MNETELENKILKLAYDDWEGHGCSVLELAPDYPRKYEDFERTGFLKREGDYIEITGLGIEETERRNLIPADKVAHYRYIRFLALSDAATAYEVNGIAGEACSKDLAEQFSLEKDEVDNNIRFLHSLELIEPSTITHFRITDKGLQVHQAEFNQRWRLDEYKRITNLEPQPRGYAFQKFIAEILESDGWDVEISVKTSYEEMDIFISEDDKHYLIEAKWKGNAIGPTDLYPLEAKINKREGVRGVFMSMSGFTPGPSEAVEDITSRNLVFLFGPRDIEEMIASPSVFRTILNQKHKELIRKRKAAWN